MSLSAEFLAPPTRTDPASGRPPVMTMASILGEDLASAAFARGMRDFG